MLAVPDDRRVPPQPEAPDQEMAMERMWKGWRVRVVDPTGQGLAEYALILSLVAIVSIVALIFLGDQIRAILSMLGASI
jgi:Flp pilus assembly pilin Flp